MSDRAVPLNFGSAQAFSLATPSFNATRLRFGSGLVLPRHHHDRAIVGITLAGQWDSVLGATRFELRPADLHIEPAGDSHMNHFGNDGAEVVVIQPHARVAGDVPALDQLLSSGRHLRASTAVSCGRRIVQELASADDLSPLAIEAAAYDLLTSAARDARDNAPPPWLAQIREFMHAHYRGTITTADLSRVAGVHPSQISRAFRCRYRISPVRYVRNLRIEWAATQLRHGRVSLVELAAAAGFADQSHFTRAFKSLFGMTPGVYRRAHRPDPSRPGPADL